MRERDPARRVPGREDALLLERSTALVGDDTLVSVSGRESAPPDERSRERPDPALVQALRRADDDGGFPSRRLAQARSSTGFGDPLVLAVGDLRLARLLVEEPNLRRARQQVAYLGAVRALAGAVAITRQRLDAIVRVQTDQQRITLADLPIGHVGPVELPVRREAIVGGSRDQSVTTAFSLRVARALFADSAFVRAMEETECELGISFEQEFLRQFNCPSVSALEPRQRLGPPRFAARSCVRDPARMRWLLPRLTPHLPGIVTGLQALDDFGLVGLLLVAPDAPLTPWVAAAPAAVAVNPLRTAGQAAGNPQLYELRGLRDTRTALAQAGPDRVVFGMIGEAFAVGSDPDAAREAARLQTRRAQRPGASAIHIPLPVLLANSPSALRRVIARLFTELLVTFEADRLALTARATLASAE